MSKQNNIKFKIYDEDTKEFLEGLSRKEYKKRLLEIVKTILVKREQFKQRGCLVVSKEFIDEWCAYVDNSLSELTNDWEDIWYNAVIIESALIIMEKLSHGLEIAISYRTIDIQEVGKQSVYYNMRLSGWQNYLATQLVYRYHEQGKEFLQYRNEFVKSPAKMKRRNASNKK